MTKPDLSGRRVCVTGIGVSGMAVVHALRDHGARITVIDARDDATTRQRAVELRSAGVSVTLGSPTGTCHLPPDTQLVVTSPGWPPESPVFQEAAAADIPVVGDVELAWWLRPRGQQWLAVTGTNGKTTVVRMVEAMLRADGQRAQAVGNVGLPVVTAVGGTEPPHDVLAVELSSFQLHWSTSVAPYAAVVLNVAADHVDWHGDMAAYARAKGKIYGPGTVRVVNRADNTSQELALRQGDPSTPLVGITNDEPRPGELGVVDGALVDRAFDGGAPTSGQGIVLAPVTEIRPAAAHNVSNALAAAALARSVGVRPESVRQGLADFTPEPHRINEVATVDGVRYVDDSKATNPHAAAASLAAYRAPVWIAGGLLKGADVEGLVAEAATRVRAVVLLGADRAQLRSALRRHAPDLPVVEVERVDDRAMDEVVSAAASLATAHDADTVLLAPAAASMDMYSDYTARGAAFVAAVHRRVPTG
ncbi:UDP-N-acetylmuramoyl-L-alanine--D-glutamate ligase [Lipingzhangella sp. LS1_29]|uniref:UDP-N-acetylmuramoylalanine--D-glutamate ligase n=1 Tax=Lipingzhangella rawalii TaxID=2055835 RepID=A0ABU2H3H2_9ACTN|nr:UDP-N-acetylmuramoyl-L-alanine--D-glutamate ligase [Lipingzhangella rawalii]MDS1269400.1 UDP-N-acetylmuramoyl-L-alanine--D-glutamate ligase [Lipingzhangella rawalii]